MKKIYLPLILIGFFMLFFSTEAKAQKISNENNLDDPIVDIYPNPASGNILNITSKSGRSITCRIFNVLGKTVAFKVITPKEKALDISSLPPGVYVLKIKVDKKEIAKKFIRQ